MAGPLVLAAIGGLTKLGATSILSTALSTGLAPGPERSIRPGSLLGPVTSLLRRDLQPVISTNPFTGSLVVSTEDQSRFLFDLLEARELRKLAKPLSDPSRVFPQFVNELVPVTSPPVVDQLREEVTTAFAMTTAKPIAPGVVSDRRPPSVDMRRLGGPCAGITSGFSRLNCARGGFA